jgi:type IV pilus assembly protein PilB
MFGVKLRIPLGFPSLLLATTVCVVPRPCGAALASSYTNRASGRVSSRFATHLVEFGHAVGALLTTIALMSTGNRLGELLVREKLISMQQLRKAQQDQAGTGKNLSYTLAKLGYISDGEITDFLSTQYRLPAINLDEYEIEADIIRLVSKEVCEKHRLIPVSRSGSSLIVAMADPANLNAIDDIKFLTRFNVEPVVASETAIMSAMDRYYNAGPSYEEVMADFQIEDEDIDFASETDDINTLELEKASEDAPVVRLVNVVLLNAIRKGASDIHIEPYEKRLRVRYRVDGVLQEEMAPPLKLKNALSSRLKIMSQLDIAERRLPQDGRIKLKLGKDREMDFRVSVLPTMWGEKIVLRLLDKSNLQLDMMKLGFEQKALDDFKWAVHQPWGMVLVTGPTGSGKTTTLYSALSELNKPGVNISTAEDPVEYNLVGINQVQMHEEIGLNFAAALRAFLRQDPDTIMVGEIRDFETAEIAVKAALTGHLVLSTLHTNDAPATISRLLNMGVEPFLITASVNLVLAQRLARKICVDCKTPFEVEAQALTNFGMTAEQIASGKLMHGSGCATCGGTGYKGRVALYEVMRFSEPLRELVLQGASTAELKSAAIRNGMTSLRMSGINKVLDGTTTVDEVLRVTMAD